MAKILNIKRRQFKELLYNIAGLTSSYGSFKFKKIGIEKQVQHLGIYKYYKADYERSQRIVKNYLEECSDGKLDLEELKIIFSEEFKPNKVSDVEYIPYVRTWEERSTEEQVQIIKEALDRKGIELIIPSD